jgi:tetratricopeptide (TPR) repeat protein
MPYARYNIFMGPTVASYGSGSYYLGLLAATMSRWQEAEQHFEDALEMNARMRARPWLAHTQHRYAEMLLARGQFGDCQKAASLLAEALAIAQELGMRSLEERVVALQEEIASQPG